ncbi:DEKNAAC100397 [Brettanomyces naardenensis]|uniref:Mannosyl-oligosaccharide glucosidase n=1 Tax=Brettanomyces naardenensis TaxID=13370 RepID=A0A448YET2_BRENA|nr:DEKNAAC100397 [Brettanomyces naardenensis]
MTLSSGISKEEKRLEENRKQTKFWKKWGTYMSERCWGVPREDYTDSGESWEFGFDMSRSRAFRWTEQGMAGVCDMHQFECITMALWNENDPFLKDSLFGLPGGSSSESGNHGEDVKELYYYLDNTPTHSYAKFLYKYPIGKFPYDEIRAGNSKRTKNDPEFEITDTDAFDDNNYFDIFFEMAKSATDPEEINFRITAYNRSGAVAPLHIIPQIFFRNTWAWNLDEYKTKPMPTLVRDSPSSIRSDHFELGTSRFVFAPAPGVSEGSPDVVPTFLFCDNNTNFKKLYKGENKGKYSKDGFHDYIVDEKAEAVNPEDYGTKACAWFVFDENGGVPAGDYVTVRYKMTRDMSQAALRIDEDEFDRVFDERLEEADEFYWDVSPLPIPSSMRNVQRQAFSGLLWTKQFYHFIHDYWYKGDPNSALPPTVGRANGRNREWRNLYNRDILSMPDSFEYPFYCSWDTAFHTIPLAMIDPEFAKKQLDLLTREWYMSAKGQIPAYEWNFSDTNPPVQAWAAYRVYKVEKKMYGKADRPFLERLFQKFLMNFTWWVNQKDNDGNGIFEGGFLGLDNISLFNRSEPPANVELYQSDASGWIAWYSLIMMNIALELARENPVYEDTASKFFEHFLLIADAMTFLNKSENDSNGTPTEESLWHEEDQFFYDRIHWGGDHTTPMKVRSLVGLIPLFATTTLEPNVLERFPNFGKRLRWLSKNKQYLMDRHIASVNVKGAGNRLLLSLVNKERLVSILKKLFAEDEFLSDYGIRSLSKYHQDHPVSMEINGETFRVKYLHGESDSGMFGGNSNWRGPIWFPTNFLLIESLLRFYLYYGSDLKVEVPTGSGDFMNLGQAAEEIQQRLIHIFIPNKQGYRAYNGPLNVTDDKEASEERIRNNAVLDLLNKDENFKNLVNFYEYFDGDTGRGLGSKWQCGWTALVARMIQDVGVICRAPKTPVRRSSCYSGEEILNYEPSSSPYHLLNRRKSGRSLFDLTAHKLELEEDEVKDHLPPGLSRQVSTKSAESESSIHDDFLRQVREAMSKFRISPQEVNISSDEFETHTN